MNKIKKFKWFIISGILLLFAFFVFRIYHKRQTLEIAYKEVKIARENIAVTVLATGTVQPENRLEIKPPVAGRIEQVLIKEGQKVKRGQLLAWMSSTERAALIDAARAQGPDEVKKWQENYKATPILAPINGTVILRNVESGQTFTNTDSVFVMSDRLTVKAQVDETDIAQIRLQQKAKMILDAYSHNIIPGTVAKIAFDAKTVNNVTTYDVDVLPGETPEFMRSGMTANVTFLVASKSDVLTVPADALKTQGNQYSVLVKDLDSPNSKLKPVEIGLNDGKRVEITSGLSEGEIVLIAEIKSFKPKNQQNSNPFGPPRVGKNPR